uniref:Uncharacterized protein n=1 Tax=Anguilla anguilla TaxID=7936 RepID=A0A0E9XWK7_ANGAN
MTSFFPIRSLFFYFLYSCLYLPRIQSAS